MHIPIRWKSLLLAPVLLACGCGGSSGTTTLPAPSVALIVPAIPAGEGYIYDGGSVHEAVTRIQMGDDILGRPAAGLLCFDISSLGQVETAILTVHQAGIQLNDAWDLGLLLVDHIENDKAVDAVDFAGGTLTSEVFALSNQPSWTLDVTALVQADLAAGRTRCSVRFYFSNVTNGNATDDLLRIGTSSHAVAWWRPTLFIEHVAP